MRLEGSETARRACEEVDGGVRWGDATKLLIGRGFSCSYAYDLIRLVRDEELSEGVVNSEISLLIEQGYRADKGAKE